MSTPDTAPTPADPEVSCEVTGFAGFEQQILRLRNSNRDNPETLEYLRWRYESAPQDPPPCIFWLAGRTGSHWAWRRQSSGPITSMACARQLR